MISLRDLLNPAQPAGYPAQDRAFGLLTLTLDQLRATSTKAETASAITDDLREQVTSTIKIADEVAQHLYFASGASDRETSSQSATPADGHTPRPAARRRRSAWSSTPGGPPGSPPGRTRRS